MLIKSPNPKNNNLKESILFILKSLRTKWKTFNKKKTNPISLRKISFPLLAALTTTLMTYARENQALFLMTTSLDLKKPNLSEKKTKMTKSTSSTIFNIQKLINFWTANLILNPIIPWRINAKFHFHFNLERKWLKKLSRPIAPVTSLKRKWRNSYQWVLFMLTLVKLPVKVSSKQKTTYHKLSSTKVSSD